MADHYTKTAFSLAADEDDILFLIEIANLDISTIPEDEFQEEFDNRSERFRKAFPATEADPFENFRKIFSDGNYPYPDFEAEAYGAAGDGKAAVIISGDQIDPETLANILQVACPSVLPTGFSYNYGCSKLRPDEFGGGYVIVTDDRTIFHDTKYGLSIALDQLDNEDARPLVLTKSDREHGLSYWNVETGFGRLGDATVFSPQDAEAMPAIIADDEPEWATMPVLTR